MFLDLDKKAPNAPAVVDNLGFSLTYGDLVGFADGFCEKRAEDAHFHTLRELCGCAGGLRRVPKREDRAVWKRMDRRLLKALIAEYRPAFLWVWRGGISVTRACSKDSGTP